MIDDRNPQLEQREIEKKKFLNACRILNVSNNASLEEIKKAYWRLAIQYHPDKNHSNRDNIEKFQQITSAYKFLSKYLKEQKSKRKDDDVKVNEKKSDYLDWWKDNFM